MNRAFKSLLILLGAVVLVVAGFATLGSRSDAKRASSDSTDSTATAPTSTLPAATSQADLEKNCRELSDKGSYLAELPGPTPGSSGLSFTSSNDKKTVIGQVTSGIMADFAAVPEASVHWSEIDRAAVLGSTDPQSAADSAKEATIMRKDKDARNKACLNLALEVANAFGSDTGLRTLKPGDDSKITEIAFWVYDPEFKTSGWLCNQAIPPDGIRLLTWKRSFREGGNALGNTVTIAVDRRELVSFTCPGESFSGTQEGPPEMETTTTSSSTTTAPAAATEDTSVGAQAPTPAATEVTTANATPSNGTSGGGDTGTQTGPGGAGGVPGGGPAPCTGTGPGCPGPAPGGAGGGATPCSTSCPGGGSDTTTGPCTTCGGATTTPPCVCPVPTTAPPCVCPTTTPPPVTTAPPTTPPPATTVPPATTLPPPVTTMPPVVTTIPPPTTTIVKGDPPNCFPDPYPNNMAGACQFS